MGTSTPCYTISTWSRNFIDLYTNFSWAVNEFHVTIRHLASHPHAESIQTLVKSMESYAQNFAQIFDNCCTQSQRGPLIDPTTDVIIQDTMSSIYEQLKRLCLLHALAWEMFKNLQSTNNYDPNHQDPPPHLDSSGISHQVSSPSKSSSSGICLWGSAPDSDQRSTGDGGEPNEPKEPNEPIKVSYLLQEPDQNGNTETVLPIPGVPENEIPPLIQIMPKSTYSVLH